MWIETAPTMYFCLKKTMERKGPACLTTTTETDKTISVKRTENPCHRQEWLTKNNKKLLALGDDDAAASVGSYRHPHLIPFCIHCYYGLFSAPA